MNKQTAVEWLIDQLHNKGFGNCVIDIPKELREQAKEMEKEQMWHFYYLDRLTADVEIGKEVGWDFEEEYNKKFNK